MVSRGAWGEGGAEEEPEGQEEQEEQEGHGERRQKPCMAPNVTWGQGMQSRKPSFAIAAGALELGAELARD